MSYYSCATAIGTENGFALMTEDGKILVTEDSKVPFVLQNRAHVDAVASLSDIACIGMPYGAWYSVIHASDQTPWASGRVEVGVGQWLGGEIHCAISNAYPDSIGPFYLAESGATALGRWLHITSPEFR